MARKATTLSTALSLLAKVKADPAILRGRKVVRIDGKMEVKKMPIGQFLTAIKDIKPIFVQRNDLYRLNNGLAKHLETFQLPQTVFALVYFEGVLYLVDGNTRKRSWLNNIYRELPSHVFVAVMVAGTEKEAVDIYNCIDSNKQKKTSRDELMSLFHNAGLNPEEMKSKLVAGGKLVSVVNCMARAMSGGSASVQRKQEVVNDHAMQFRVLDTLNLDEGVIDGGGVWALLRLYRNVPADQHFYVNLYAEELRKLKTPTASTAASSVLGMRLAALRACQEENAGTSGEKPIPVMFPHYLVGFSTFAKQVIRAGGASAKFKKFVSTQLPNILDYDLVRAQAMMTKTKTKAKAKAKA